MRCAKCPLFSSWNNENGSGELCAFFGDDWGHPMQYEDKDGTIVGCYIMPKGVEEFDKYRDREMERMTEYMVKNLDGLLK